MQNYSGTPPLALQILAPLLLFCGSPWLPESPRWLVMKGRTTAGNLIKTPMASKFINILNSEVGFGGPPSFIPRSGWDWGGV